MPAKHNRTTSLREVAWLFLKLGTIAFGGPAAHIAMMEDEVVRRRKWLTRDKFLDLLGATNLIPGPNSTEMAIHIGYLRAGWPGLLVAGSCFILPAVAIVFGFAWIYVRYGSLPETARVLYGVKRLCLKSHLILVSGGDVTEPRAVASGIITQPTLSDEFAFDLRGRVFVPLTTVRGSVTLRFLVVAGTKGAIVATIGIFLPAFVFVAIGGPLVPRIRRSPTAAGFLDGVIMASLGLIVVVTYELSKAALVDMPTIGLAVISAVVLFRWKVNSAWIVLGGALMGFLIHLF